ncbi:MAG: type II toxin-antitoxin system VapC family toxin [Alphaproteobacteria bacterium]
MIVVDASALVEMLLRMPAADQIERRLFDTGEALHAPHLLDIEITQVVRRFASRGDIGDEAGRAALADLAAFGIERHSHDVFLPRVWELRHNLTAYDAVYVALAETLPAPLLTRDRRLASAGGHRAQIELV